MSVEITMPQLSDTMSEGTIVTWFKKEGDKVKRGDALAEVETDKANLEIEAFHEGTLLRILIPSGQSVQIGAPIALVGKDSEMSTESHSHQPPVTLQRETSSVTAQISESATQSHTRSTAQSTAPSTSLSTAQPHQYPAPEVLAQTSPHTPSQNLVNASAHALAQPTDESVRQTDDRIKISPLARNVAKAYDIEVSELTGSGEGGRIMKRDVEKARERAISHSDPTTAINASAAQQYAATNFAPQLDINNINTMTETHKSITTSAPNTNDEIVLPFSKMRATIAERMSQSTSTIPHFYTTTKILADNLVKVRTSLKTLPQYEGITYNHLIIRATALTLEKFPRINSAYTPTGIKQPSSINIGIITAVNDGLLIPVVKNASQLSLADLVAESRTLVQRARSQRPKPTDLVGGTFSISNMGLFAVESFTAIISPGQGGILAVSALAEEPVIEHGNIRVGQVMRLTLSVDHRIVDGVLCGEFVTELKRLLEDPILLLA